MKTIEIVKTKDLNYANNEIYSILVNGESSGTIESHYPQIESKIGERVASKTKTWTAKLNGTKISPTSSLKQMIANIEYIVNL